MRKTTLFTAVALALLATDTLNAQRRARGRNRDQWRRPEEITNRVGVYFQEVQGPETQDDKVADLNTIPLVREAAAGLPPRQRQVVVFKVFSEMTYREVAEVMEGAVENTDGNTALAKQVLVRLAEIYRDFLDEPEGATRSFKRASDLDPEDGEILDALFVRKNQFLFSHCQGQKNVQ